MNARISILGKRNVIIKNNKQSKKQYFYILEQLGQGGFSKCFSVVDITNVQFSTIQQLKKEIPQLSHYAIKMIKRQQVQNNKSTIRKRLYNEIRIHKKMKHQNIVQMYDAFKDQQHYYLRLQLCQKINLHDILSQRKFLQPHEVVYFYHQILRGVAYLHQQNIAHRDLKLANIMLKKNQNQKILTAKIGDFGLARYVSQQIFSKCGTPGYVSPQLLDKDRQTLSVDIWALGVLVYHMRFGQTPFVMKGTSVNITYENIRNVNIKIYDRMLQGLIKSKNKEFEKVHNFLNFDIKQLDKLIEDFIYSKALKKKAQERSTAVQLKKQQLYKIYYNILNVLTVDQYILKVPAITKDLQIKDTKLEDQKDLTFFEQQVQNCNIDKPKAQLFILKCYFYQEKRSCFILSNGWLIVKFGHLYMLQTQQTGQQSINIQTDEIKRMCICFKNKKSEDKNGQDRQIEIIAKFPIQIKGKRQNLQQFKQQVSFFYTILEAFKKFREQANKSYKIKRKQNNCDQQPLQNMYNQIKVGNVLNRRYIPFILHRQLKRKCQIFKMSNGIIQVYFNLNQKVLLFSQTHQNIYLLNQSQDSQIIKGMHIQEVLNYSGPFDKQVKIFKPYIQHYLKNKQQVLIKMTPDIDTYAWSKGIYTLDNAKKNVCTYNNGVSDWLCSSQNLPLNNSFAFVINALKITKKNQIQIGVMDADRKNKPYQQNHKFVVALCIQERIIKSPKQKISGFKAISASCEQFLNQIPTKIIVHVNRQLKTIKWFYNGRQQTKYHMPQSWRTERELCAIVRLWADGDCVEFL